VNASALTPRHRLADAPRHPREPRARSCHPQTHGKDERFHRTLKAELLIVWCPNGYGEPSRLIPSVVVFVSSFDLEREHSRHAFDGRSTQELGPVVGQYQPFVVNECRSQLPVLYRITKIPTGHWASSIVHSGTSPRSRNSRRLSHPCRVTDRQAYCSLGWPGIGHRLPVMNSPLIENAGATFPSLRRSFLVSVPRIGLLFAERLIRCVRRRHCPTEDQAKSRALSGHPLCPYGRVSPGGASPPLWVHRSNVT
jgi:hypothetical protein